MDEFKPEDELKPDASDRRPSRPRKSSTAARIPVSRQRIMMGVGILVLLLLVLGIGSALNGPDEKKSASAGTTPAAGGSTGSEKNIDLTGCKNWYEWNTSNWGTKWEACKGDADFEKDTATFSFSTAWAAPTPIFEALAREFPKCFIDIDCRDEGGFGGYGFSFEPQVEEYENGTPA